MQVLWNVGLGIDREQERAGWC